MDLQDIIQEVGEWHEWKITENKDCDFEIIDNIDHLIIKARNPED